MLSYQPSHHPHTSGPRTRFLPSSTHLLDKENPNTLSQSTSSAFHNAKTPAPSRTLLGKGSSQTLTVGPKQLLGKTSNIGLGTEIKQRNTNLGSKGVISIDGIEGGVGGGTPVKMMKGGEGLGKGRELMRGKTPSKTEIGPQRLFTSTQAQQSSLNPQTERKPKSHSHKTPHKSTHGLNLRGGAVPSPQQQRQQAFFTPAPPSRLYSNDNNPSPTSSDGFVVPADQGKFQNLKSTPLPSSVRSRKRSTIGGYGSSRLSVSGGMDGLIEGTPMKQLGPTTPLGGPSSAYALATPAPSTSKYQDLGDKYKTPCRPTSGGGYGSLLGNEEEDLDLDLDEMEELEDYEGGGGMDFAGGMGKSPSMMQLEGVEGVEGVEGAEGEESDGDVEYMPPRAVPLPHETPFNVPNLPHLHRSLLSSIPGDYLISYPDDIEDDLNELDMVKRWRADEVDEDALREIEKSLDLDGIVERGDEYGFSGLRMKTELEMEEPSLRNITAFKIQQRKQQETQAQEEINKKQKQENRALEAIAEEETGLKKTSPVGLVKKNVGGIKRIGTGMRQDLAGRAGATTNKPVLSSQGARIQKSATTLADKNATSGSRLGSAKTTSIPNQTSRLPGGAASASGLKKPISSSNIARGTTQHNGLALGGNSRIGKNIGSNKPSAVTSIKNTPQIANHPSTELKQDEDGGDGYDYEALEKEMLAEIDDTSMELEV